MNREIPLDSREILLDSREIPLDSREIPGYWALQLVLIKLRTEITKRKMTV